MTRGVPLRNEYSFGCICSLAFLLAISSASIAFAQMSRAEEVWQPHQSTNLVPHMEQVNGHELWYVDGEPFSMLAVEIPWWDLRVGHYRGDEDVYDNLYPKASELGANTLKVPVKWSMVEPEKDQYDFSYVDHAIKMAGQNHLHLVLDWFGHYASGDGNIYRNLTGELFAPMYIVRDETTYPRAIDGTGMLHHAAISYDSQHVIDREVKAFRAFMLHLKQTDTHHVVAGIQLENEISIFGGDRHNPNLFRNHSEAANVKFASHHFMDDLRFSAWDLSTSWIKPLTEAGHSSYPIPIFHNFVNGSTEPGLVGGSPGEDVKTYLDDCPQLSFIAVNAYFCADWHGGGCAAPSQAATEELQAALHHFQIGRNIPAVTETNSGDSAVAPRFAYVALGDYGVPIFAPWALTMSYPESNQPYLLHDGDLANGTDKLREAYQSLEMALPQILTYAGTDKLKMFQAPASGQHFSQQASVDGLSLRVRASDNGQAIVIHPSDKQLLIVGYRVNVSLQNPKLVWPSVQDLQVERVHWDGAKWAVDGGTFYGVDQSSKSLWVNLEYPQAVLVTLP